MRKQIFLLVAFSCIIACSVSTAAKSETFRTEIGRASCRERV